MLREVLQLQEMKAQEMGRATQTPMMTISMPVAPTLLPGESPKCWLQAARLHLGVHKGTPTQASIAMILMPLALALSGMA